MELRDRGRVYYPPKKTRESRLTTLLTPPAGRPRALAPIFRRHNIREEGVAEDLTEEHEGRAQKVTRWRSFMVRTYDMVLLYHAMRPLTYEHDLH